MLLVCSTDYMMRRLLMGEMEMSLYGGFQVAAAVCDICCATTIIIHRQKVRTVIDGFQQIFDRGIR